VEPALGVLVALGVAVFLRLTLGRVTVFEYEQGLRYRNGRSVGGLGPGAHWIFRPTTVVRKVDIRPRFVSLAGQEVLSSDGVTVRVTIAARYEIADGSVAINKVENYQEALYLTLQLALRQIVGQATIDEVLRQRDQFGERLRELTAEDIASFGLRLLDVNVKDIMFPGELKKTFALVVQAQKEGQATLERARGETAALRNLANAAQLVESTPALLQLRLLQQLSASSGHTIVLGFPGASLPLTIRRNDQTVARDQPGGRPEGPEQQR
jgi:regulator of protease activity HflC (stomatin/prohibitin superfamily)